MTEPGYIQPAVPSLWVKKNAVVFPQPATLTMTGGTPDVLTPRLVQPTGATLTRTAGAPTVTVAPAIAFVSSATSNSSTVTMPTHATGDRLLIFAFRPANVTPPSLPAGWTDVVNGGGSGTSCRVGTKPAASSSEVSGTWTNAQDLIVAVYRNVSSIGASARNDGSATGTFIVPGLSLTVTNRTSWVVMFTGTNATAGTMPAATNNGFGRRNSMEGPTEDMGLYDTGIWQTSFGVDAITYGSNGAYQTVAVELVD